MGLVGMGKNKTAEGIPGSYQWCQKIVAMLI